MSTAATPSVIRLHPADNVVVAKEALPVGAALILDGATIITRAAVAAGHKIAVRGVAAGEPLRKYDQIIGFASAPIAPGDHVHNHNLSFAEFQRNQPFCSELRPTRFVPDAERATFQGYVRADGRIGTRNYIAILTTVNCSASTARYIADAFRGEALKDYPNVDGVIALTQNWGCGMARKADGYQVLQRTIAGYARHPNIGGVLILGLGCEVNQPADLVANFGLDAGPLRHVTTIQDEGGTAATVRDGVARIKAMLPEVNRIARQRVPASALILGTNCGGSDGFSGITANPALGHAADLLVRHGGTVVLAETTEIYGAEHLLASRAVSPAVAEKLIERVRWWERYTKANNAEIDNNPTPGNKAGGLTTILEKSLGAVAKAGTTNLTDVYHYAEPITAKGFVFMDTPGYDPVSVTGIVAGGATVMCFTTGRGSVFGCKPTPSLKLATNTPLYHRMTDDMDLNCGLIADGEASVEEMGRRIFESVLETASGRPTKSEALGLGDAEFVPWQIGAVL